MDFFSSSMQLLAFCFVVFFYVFLLLGDVSVDNFNEVPLLHAFFVLFVRYSQ